MRQGSGTHAGASRARRAALLAVVLAGVLALASESAAGPGPGSGRAAPGGGGAGSSFGTSPYGGGLFDLKAYVPDSLLAQIRQKPTAVYPVIVQAADDRASAAVVSDVRTAQRQEGGTRIGRVDSRFTAIGGVSAQLSGWQILRLASRPGILAITPDIPVDSIVPVAGSPVGDYQNAEMWRDSVRVRPLLRGGPAAPVIAVVDSGIEPGRADFGDRLLGSVNLSTLSHGLGGDQEGHGTMVAGLAAGGLAGYPGAAPTARLIDVKTADASGRSLTADVIRACDWILLNKDRYGIRVANFSLVSAPVSSFAVDPLDRAVEKLWLNGVVVVAAAGNYGMPGMPVDMSHAPGNSPFVITVGALDQNGTSTTDDDSAAPWSAFGSTVDGFSKPDVAAPGRYLIAPVPQGAYVPSVVPSRIVAPGYMWMSGTSLAAAIVTGAAAQILAWHPDWTPDQVKGALISSARYVPAAAAAGAGEIDVAAAVSLPAPPNPNASLDPYVVTDRLTGVRRFDMVAWLRSTSPGVLSGVSTGAGPHATTSWTSAAWTSASWSSAAWTSAAWTSAAWTSAAWTSTSWSSLIWLP